MIKLLLGILLIASVSATAAERIASLSPNLTEIIAKLGAEDQLVGRTDKCNYPASIKKLPIIGQFSVPEIESLMATRPTLVISETKWQGTKAERLQELGIKLELFPAETLEDYFRNLSRLGTILGKEQAAQTEIDHAKQRIAAWGNANAALTKEGHPRVLVVIGVNPLVTAGEKSFLTRLIELAGGDNVAGKINKKYFTCSLEQIVLWQPEVILAPGLSAKSLQELKKSPSWKLLPAVKLDRIITDFDADLLYRLGPRTLDGIAQLRQLLQVSASHRSVQSNTNTKITQILL